VWNALVKGGAVWQVSRRNCTLRLSALKKWICEGQEAKGGGTPSNYNSTYMPGLPCARVRECVRECACGHGGVRCMPSFSIREYGDTLVLRV
jgi:hypothetical protein